MPTGSRWQAGKQRRQAGGRHAGTPSGRWQLGNEIIVLTRATRAKRDNPRLEATSQAKSRRAGRLANQIGAARRSARAGEPGVAPGNRDRPDEPTNPNPCAPRPSARCWRRRPGWRGGWWTTIGLPGRQASRPCGPQATRGGPDRARPELALRARRLATARRVPSNGSRPPPGRQRNRRLRRDRNWSRSCPVFWMGRPSDCTRRTFQLAAEEIAHRFQVDLAAILLDNAGEVQTMGSVGLRASRTRHHRSWYPSPHRGGGVAAVRGWSIMASSPNWPARASETTMRTRPWSRWSATRSDSAIDRRPAAHRRTGHATQ